MKFNAAVKMVKEWNEKFKHIPKNDDEREDLWRNDFYYRELAFDLIGEEVNELYDAAGLAEYTEVQNWGQKDPIRIGCESHLPKENDVEVLDALVDILVTVFGMAAKAGLDELLEPAFKEVMRANYSKLGPDGHPVYYDSGKIAKSESYTPPNLRQFFDKEELED